MNAHAALVRTDFGLGVGYFATACDANAAAGRRELVQPSNDLRITCGGEPHFKAWRGLQGDVATICAWCPDKASADAWCAEKGYKVSHGICPECRPRFIESSDVSLDAESSRATPRREAAVASTPTAAAAAIGFIHSDPQGPAGEPEYVPLHIVAAACGVDEFELHTKFRPDHWGVPRHWKFVKCVTLYSAAHLYELADELAKGGKPYAAELLRRALLRRAVESQTAAPSSPPAGPRRRRGLWFNQGNLA